MKYIHINFKNASLFLNTDGKKQYEHNNLYNKDGKNMSGIDLDILCKSTIRNVLLKMCGEITIPTHCTERKNKTSFELVNFFYETNNIAKKFINEVDKCINNSFYKLYDNYSYKTKKDETKYLIEFKQGLFSTKQSESPLKTTIGDYIFNSSDTVSFESLKNCKGITQEIFDELCQILHELTGLIPYENSLHDFILKMLKIDKSIKQEKFKNFLETYKLSAYPKRFIDFLIFPEDNCIIKEDKKIVDVRFNRGKTSSFSPNTIKYCLTFNGEFYIQVTDDIFEKIKKWYTPARMFDGGIAYITEIIEEEDFNSDYVKIKGFKNISKLKEKYYVC